MMPCSPAMPAVGFKDEEGISASMLSLVHLAWCHDYHAVKALAFLSVTLSCCIQSVQTMPFPALLPTDKSVLLIAQVLSWLTLSQAGCRPPDSDHSRLPSMGCSHYLPLPSLYLLLAVHQPLAIIKSPQLTLHLDDVWRQLAICLLHRG